MNQFITIVFIILAVAYIVLPYDLDHLGLIGRIDEGIVLWYLYRKYKQLTNRFGPTIQDSRHRSDPQGAEEQTTQEMPKSPYEVLELSVSATPEDIEKQYRKLAAQYHPDKVSHLGAELQKVAHEKMLQIQDAYEKLSS